MLPASLLTVSRLPSRSLPLDAPTDAGALDAVCPLREASEAPSPHSGTSLDLTCLTNVFQVPLFHRVSGELWLYSFSKNWSLCSLAR